MSTAAGQARGSTSPGVSQIPQHAPMSERQQLALIKRLELAATASTLTPNNGEILQLNFIYARNCQRPFHRQLNRLLAGDLLTRPKDEKGL